MSSQLVKTATTIYHCAVCGDTARYLFYGSRSCDSCRTFFRRQTVLASSSARRCRFDNKCDVTVKTRRFCTACRLAKCRRVGMMGELVAVDDDCLILMDKPFENIRTASGAYNCRDQGWTSNLFHKLMALKKITNVPRPMSTCDFTIYVGTKATILRGMSSYEINKIEELSSAGHLYKRLLPDADDHVDSHRDATTCGFLNAINTGTQKIIGVLPAFTAFRNLEPCDREVLARDAVVEVLITWSLFFINTPKTHWVTSCLQRSPLRVPELLSTEVLKRANDSDQLYNNYMRLARTFDSSWRRDPFICSLFAMISIFGDRSGLQEGTTVALERSVFTSLLNRYIEAVYGPRRKVEAMTAMSAIYSCLAQVASLRQQFRHVQMDTQDTPLAII